MTYKHATCQICDTTDDFKVYEVHDRMFSKRDSYQYVVCSQCDSMQIDNLPDPETLSKLYHSDYYSFQAEKNSLLREKVQGWRDSAIMKTRSPLHRLLGELPRRLQSDTKLETLAELGVMPQHRILDVGCGAGKLIDRLKRAGYQNISGADPYITEGTKTHSGAPIQKATIHEVVGAFDIIMFNHSFEHVTTPLETLHAAIDRLTPQGKCIVRVPTTSSEAWETYRENWVQIDAPRHTFIPSRKGMAHLAKRIGADLIASVDDSSAFQFIGSELYKKDMSLFPEEGGPSRAAKPLSFFTEAQVKEWEERAQLLNDEERGDQTSFVIQKAA